MRALSLGDRLKQADWLLLGVGVSLAVVGVVTVEVASQSQRIDYGWMQLRWAVIGVALCLLMLAVPYRRVVDWRWVLYVGGIVLLLAVLVAGRGKSARRWIELGSFRIQPSELMKIIVVITLAGFIRYQHAHRRFKGLVAPFALTFIPVALIMKQPDLGTALLLVPVLFTMLYVAGAKRSHLAIVAGAGLVAAVVAFFTPGLLKEYQKDRVRAFLLQESEDPALRRNQNHQLHHAKTVVGAAPFAGSGLGDETQEAARFLPERHSDFVFPVFVAAFGLPGATFVFLLYAAFVALLLKTAIRVREPSGRLLALGFASLVACQTVVNLGMTLGLFPIVGMPLPFLSYGGSSLLTTFLGLGLVLNVGADHPVEFGRGDFDG